MANEPYQSFQIPLVDAGLLLRRPPDRVERGRYRRHTNLIPGPQETSLRLRYGTRRFIANPLPDPNIHTLGFLNDPVTPGGFVLGGAGKNLYRLDTSIAIDSNYSGNPLALVPYRMPSSSLPFMLVGDSSQMRKFNSTGVATKLGITPPAGPTVDVVEAAATTTIENFTADAGFTYVNMASHSAAASFPNGVVAKLATALQVQTNASASASLTKVVAVDLSKIGNLAATDADYFHLWLNVDNPTNITEIRILFDIASDSITAGAFNASAFTRNYYVIALYGNALQAALNQAQTFLTAQQQALAQASQAATPFPTGLQPFPLPASQTGSVSGQTVTGQVQWTELFIQRSKFLRVGSDTTRSWANVNGFQIQIIATAGQSPVVTFNSLYFFGGMGGDSNFGTGYDWRHTYAADDTLEESNLSPVQAGAPPGGTGTAVVRQPVTLTPDAFSLDPQVDIIKFYRRGGNLTATWLFLGQQANHAISVVAVTRAANVVTLQTDVPHKMLVGQGVNVSGVTDASFNGDFVITSIVDTTHFTYAQIAGNAASAGGSVKFDDVFADIQIASNANGPIAAPVAGGPQIPTNDVPVTTVDKTGKTLFGVPLYAIWGPFQGVTIFGCGDPNRPGYLYWSNPGDAGAWSSLNNIETSPAEDPLMNGFVWDNTAFVFSKETLYQIYSNQIGLPNQYQPVKTACGRGLFAKWAFVADINTPGIFFRGKDGIYLTTGGQESSLTDDDLYPIFHGQAVESYSPVDDTHPEKQRMWYYDQEVYFQYQDTLGGLQTIAFHVLKARWRHANYGFNCLIGFAQPEVGQVLLFGSATTGLVYIEDRTLATDDGSPIALEVRTGAYDMGFEFREKEFGNVLIDVDPGGAQLTPVVLYDWEQNSEAPALAAFSGVGRQAIPIPLNDSYGRNALIDISGSVSAAVVIYGVEFAWRFDETALKHWEAPESGFGIPGYKHLFQGYVVLRSTADLTLTLIGDGTVIGTYVIPSTGGSRLSRRVDVNVNKWKLLRVKADCPSEFRIYREDSIFELYPWQGGGLIRVPMVGGLE